MKVLYVEDSQADISLVRHELLKSGNDFDLDSAGTVHEALKKIKADATYDVALVDLRLPDGDGISILNEIRQKKLPIAVVMITGFGDEDVAVGALKAGADDYVVKSGKHYKELPSILRRNADERERRRSFGTSIRVLFVGGKGPEVESAFEHLSRKSPHIKIETALSKSDFLSKIAGTDVPYDVFLIEQGTKEINVLDTIKELRNSQAAGIPVVVLADSGTQEKAALAMKVGASDYVVKSEHFQIKLASVLESALQRARLERERAALKESEERHRMISGLISDYAYVFKVDPEGKIDGEWLSDSFQHRFGYTLTEVRERGGWQALVHPDDLPIIMEHVRKVVSGDIDTAEFRFVTRSGESRWLRDSASPVWGFAHKRVVRIYGASQDITDRKVADDEVRRSEARFKELSDFLPEPVFETDRNRKIVFANRAFTELFGVESIRLNTGLDLLDFFSKEDRERAAERLDRVLEGKDLEPERFDVKAASGADVPVLLSVSPIIHESEVVGVRGVLTDLTEITAAHEAAAAGENKYRFIFESSADEFYLLDERGIFLQVNEAGCERLGFAREEMIGQSLNMILSPEHKIKTEERVKAILLRKDVTFESVHVRKDGTQIPVEVRSRAALFDGKPVLLSVARDLTERKKAEDAIARRNRQLRILSAASMKVNALLNADEILRTLVMSGIELIGAKAGTVGLIENGVLTFKEYCEEGKFREINAAFSPGEGIPGEVWLSKHPKIVVDCETSDSPAVMGRGESGVYNLVDVPILNRTGEVLGVFAVHNSEGKRPFSEEDVEMLESLASSAAVALENAKLIADITRADAAIRESEEKFRTLVESSLVGVYIVQDDRFVYANPAMAKIYGYTPEEFLAIESVRETVAPDDRERVDGYIRQRIYGEIPSVKYDYNAIRKDGSIVRVEALGSKTIYAGWPAIIGTAEDVTQRKIAEEMLRRSEERYRHLFEDSLDTIYVTTPSGKFIDINTAGVTLLGYDSKEELLSLESVSELYEDPGERESAKALLEKHGFIKDNPITLKRKDGGRIIVHDSSTVIRDADGKIAAYRGILKDVTEKKMLEEQLLQSQKLESLGQLTSGIAHDFNNVLGGIIGFAELALGKVSDDHPVNSYLTRIYGLADRAAKITKQLLAFSRRQILMPRDVDLNSLIEEMLELLRRLLGERIQIRFAPGRSLSTVKVDPSQFEQVLLNLAVNAGDAMKQVGTLTIETANVFLDEAYCRKHAGVKPGEYVMTSVSDTGMGIEPSVMERIFEPFFTTKEIGKGTGLGLSVVHGIVRQHGGTINVYSEVGKGSTFTVYFPALKGVAVSPADQQNEVRELEGGTETILLVEDNDEMREFMSTLLIENGYEVLAAHEGEEGVRIFEQNASKIALVITDIVMPKMTGRELRDAIRAKFSHSKFLFISGYADSVVHHGFILDEKVDFLQKPFNAFDFTRRAREIIDRRNP